MRLRPDSDPPPEGAVLETVGRFGDVTQHLGGKGPAEQWNVVIEGASSRDRYTYYRDELNPVEGTLLQWAPKRGEPASPDTPP